MVEVGSFFDASEIKNTSKTEYHFKCKAFFVKKVIKVRNMDYELKANITTILSFLFLPFLAGLGMDSVTSSAVVGVLATLVVFVFMYFNERYLSKIFTKQGYDVVNKDEQYTCNCEEDAINQEYVVKDTDNQEYDVEDGA